MARRGIARSAGRLLTHCQFPGLLLFCALHLQRWSIAGPKQASCALVVKGGPSSSILYGSLGARTNACAEGAGFRRGRSVAEAAASPQRQSGRDTGRLSTSGKASNCPDRPCTPAASDQAQDRRFLSQLHYSTAQHRTQGSPGGALGGGTGEDHLAWQRRVSRPSAAASEPQKL